MNNQRKKGAILSYVSIITSTLVQLLYTPFLIKMLGQSEYGLYSLVSSIIGYLTVLDLGFGNAIIVYTAKYREQKKYDEMHKLHGMFSRVYLIIALIAGILGIILTLNVKHIFANSMTLLEIQKMEKLMLILTFNLVMTFAFSIYSSILSAYEQFVYQKVMAILNTLLKPLIMIPLLFLGFKSITMTLVITGINVFILLLNYLSCKCVLRVETKFQGLDKILFKEILGYSIWIFIGVIVDKINWSADQFILGIYSEKGTATTEISIYSVASTLNTLFISLSGALSGVFLPKISKMVARSASDEELTNEFIKVGRLQYYIIFLMVSGLAMLGKNFIENIWVGPNYTKSYYIALILIIPVCVPLIQNLGLSIMQAKNKFKFRSIVLAIMSVFNIILSIFLVKKYSAIGAAVGTAISLIVCNVFIINIYYYKTIKLNIVKFWKQIIIMSIKFLIPVVITLIIIKYLPLVGIKAFIAYGSIYVVLFSLWAYLICMNSYEKNLVNSIFGKFKKLIVRS